MTLKAPRPVRALPFLAAAIVVVLSASAPARADAFPESIHSASAPPATPVLLGLLVRSTLAESEGDAPAAIAWAESLAHADPFSAYGFARVATLREAVGDDPEALSWGERALSRDSLNLEAAMLVGRMRLRAGESEVAAQVLTPPLRQLGAPPEAYALRALAHELSRRYDAALADLGRTDELLPDFAWIATGILGLSLEDGRLTEASQALRLALELRPEDPRVLHLGVTLARQLGDPALEETLHRSLALAPDASPDEIAAYGSFLMRMGRESSFDKLVAWASDGGAVDEANLRVETGHALIREGRYGEALRAVKRLKKDPRALPVRARAYVSLGDDRKALECYRPLLPGTTLSREESLVVAYLEIQVGDRARGVETLERARAARLDTPRQVLAASLCYSLLGYPDEAVTLIRDAASRGVSSPSVADAGAGEGDFRVPVFPRHGRALAGPGRQRPGDALAGDPAESQERTGASAPRTDPERPGSPGAGPRGASGRCRLPGSHLRSKSSPRKSLPCPEAGPGGSGSRVPGPERPLPAHAGPHSLPGSLTPGSSGTCRTGTGYTRLVWSRPCLLSPCA